MDAKRTMLDAHVRFMLDRWSGDGIRDRLSEELDALFAWSGEVTIDEVAPAAEVLEALLRIISTPLPDELEQMVTDGLTAVLEALAQDETQLGETVSEEGYDAAVEAIVGMRELRQEVIAQVTASTVYAELIAHVLYHGIKDYLVTQSAITRRIPGASSMLRLGQSAVSAAVPGLERSVDKQLTFFISANVADTVQGSGAFLERILDDTMIWTVAAELWNTNIDRTVGDLARLVSMASLADVSDTVFRLWEGVRELPVVTDVVTAAVDAFYAAHGEQTAADLIGSLGITAETVADLLADVASPGLEAARESGYLESRIRAHLEPFYAGYPFAGDWPDANLCRGPR